MIAAATLNPRQPLPRPGALTWKGDTLQLGPAVKTPFLHLSQRPFFRSPSAAWFRLLSLDPHFEHS